MKLETTAAVAEIISSVAIVVTLGYLAIQTRQNTEAVNSSALQSIFDSAQQQLEFNVTNANIEGLTYKPTLTREESTKVFLALTLSMRDFEHTWIQFNDGIISRTALDSLTHGPILGILASQRARTYWDKIGPGEFEPGFVTYVNGLLKNVPPSERSRTWMFAGDSRTST